MAGLPQPDYLYNNNPNEPLNGFSNQIKGGRRVVNNLTELYALVSVANQLEQNISIVRVLSENADFLLTNISNIGISSGWSKVTIVADNNPVSGGTNAISSDWAYRQTLVNAQLSGQTANSVTFSAVTTALGYNPEARFLTQYGRKDSTVLSGTNDYNGSLTPAITAYTHGMRIRVLPTNTNTTGATININGLGAYPILNSGGALTAQDFPANQWQDLTFTTASTGSWQLSSANNNKLNIGANTTLAGSGYSFSLINSTGTIIRDSGITYDTNTKTMVIGASTAVTGNLQIWSNEFKVKVQENIADGQASIEFNDNQSKALVFKSSDGKEYIALRSTDNDEAVIFLQKFVFDQGVFAPLNSLQGQATTTTTGKTYFNDTLGSVIRIPFNVDGQTMHISGMVKGINNAGTVGNEVFTAKFDVVLKRTGSTISVVSPTPSITRITDTLSTNFIIGAEGGNDVSGNANSAVLLYVQPNTTTAIDWKLSKVEYVI